MSEELALAVRQVFRQLDLDCNTHLHQKHAALLTGLSLIHKGLLIHSYVPNAACELSCPILQPSWSYSTMVKSKQQQLMQWLRLVGLLDVANHHAPLHCLLWFPLHDATDTAPSSSDKQTIAVVLADGATRLLAQFVVWNRACTPDNARMGNLDPS